jgi:putative methionine-R-sulfoxide reductase with GAF domain
MDHYSILDPPSPIARQPLAPPPVQETEPSPAWGPEEPVRFPGDDGGQSLAETAGRDLDAALQLLAERARYITGAMAATIALREGTGLLCRASTGSIKQKTGVPIQVGSGLATESMRTRRILRCHDASTDSRVNAEKCSNFGIASAIVMPLVRGQEIVGVFELLSGNPNTFEERDLNAMERLGEMIETAVEHAAAAPEAEQPVALDEILAEPEVIPLPPVTTPPTRNTRPIPAAIKEVLPEPVSGPEEDGPLLERGTIGNCRACGFPVSSSRSLCVDCATGPAKSESSSAPVPAPAFLSETDAAPPARRSWLRYALGVLLFAAILAEVAMLWLRFH